MEAYFTEVLGAAQRLTLRKRKVVKGDPFTWHPTAELIWQALIACRDFVSVLVGLFYGSSL